VVMPPAVAEGFMVAVAVLASFIGLDCVRRSERAPGRQLSSWILVAAVVSGSAVWSLSVVGLNAQGLPMALGFQPLLLFVAWALGVALAYPGWLLGFGRNATIPTLFLAAATLTGSVVVTYALGLLAPGFRPGFSWELRPLLTALGGCISGLSLALFALKLGRDRHPALWLRTPVAVLLMAGTLLWVHGALLASADLAGQTNAAYAGVLPMGSVLLLATVGTGLLLGVVLVSSFIDSRMSTSLLQAQGRLREQATTDQLTGLLNRPSFDVQLQDAVTRAEAGHSSLAVLFIDLDGFKALNQSYGHNFGDQLLVEMAERMRRCIREPLPLARWAGDEFLLLIDHQVTQDHVAALAHRLIDQLAQTVQIDGREAQLTASIGVSMFPADGTPATLIAHADAAARAAKAAGGATYCFFQPSMVQDTRDQVELLRDLRIALDKGELELFYQPKVHAPSGQITGAEALLRWNHPVRGLVSPALFVPVAEKFGLINAIGDWALDEACKQIRQWRDGGLRMRVAVNLSVQQLRQPNLHERVAQVLEKYSINPQLLTCEITESMAMEDTEVTKRLFDQLAGVGVHISIDDFGSGYSSLAYLRQLPTEELKIDRSFVLDLETSSDARAVVDAVVKLGQALGLKVVAEGVETEAQYRILRQLGCDELQGFYFAKPMASTMLYLWAMTDNDPKTPQFRPSLFGDTQLSPLQGGPH
jgi:diguanylate cyclase